MSIFEDTKPQPWTQLRSALGASEAAARVARWVARLPYFAAFAYLVFAEGHYTTLGIGLSVLGLFATPVIARASGSSDTFWNSCDIDGDSGDGGCGGGCGGGD